MHENDSARLARSITKSSSLQTFLTAVLLVDRGKVDDCCRAYAYFRWVDDEIDNSKKTAGACRRFLARQKELAKGLYAGRFPASPSAEEEMLVDLVKNDRKKSPYLKSYIFNFFKILEFDVQRRGKAISDRELKRYSGLLGKAVTDAIFYFIGNGRKYPDAQSRYLAATAAHIVHMLRDYRADIKSGYFNAPKDYLDRLGVSPQDISTPAFKAWAKKRVALARRYLSEGKGYIDSLSSLRCKIAAYWYCARFEDVLSTIESDGYVLRFEYPRRGNLVLYPKMALLALPVMAGHVFGKRITSA